MFEHRELQTVAHCSSKNPTLRSFMSMEFAVVLSPSSCRLSSQLHFAVDLVDRYPQRTHRPLPPDPRTASTVASG